MEGIYTENTDHLVFCRDAAEYLTQWSLYGVRIRLASFTLFSPWPDLLEWRTNGKYSEWRKSAKKS